MNNFKVRQFPLNQLYSCVGRLIQWKRQKNWGNLQFFSFPDPSNADSTKNIPENIT